MSPSKAMNLKTFSYRAAFRLRNRKRSAWGLGPKYTDLPELSQQYSMNCDNHLHGDDSSWLITSCFHNQRLAQELKGRLSLPGSWFWACIKAQRAAESSHSLFAFRELLIELLKKKNDSHQRYWFCWPLSLCLYGKWRSSSRDIPICPSRPPVGLYNGRHYLRTIHCQERSSQPMGVSKPVQAQLSLTWIQPFGKFPCCDKTPLRRKGPRTRTAPKYTDLYELSHQVPVSCNNHVNGDTSSCSKRISFTFAGYLESLEEDQRQMNDEKKEEEEVVIDCRDPVLDKICLTKHNVQYTILLR
ncbi:hypothetical protein CEXT_300971 [Caerostris extrusa]|uniref:Uncharacterized protein n=1 Tax=Caerostris extrusa TaxID=172846 RepID=A0AAV4MS17_CAEEX|nr:hypothetical protein CEXT_300971 [Caerostris extrusa]